MSGVDASQIARSVATLGATFLGGIYALGFVTSSLSEHITLHKKKKHGRSCQSCKAIGYYSCKLCKGHGTVKWSPVFDPVFINPCVCPSCDGFKVQRCLNCLGYGSV